MAEEKKGFWATVWRLLKHLLFSLAGTGTDLLVLWLFAHLVFRGFSEDTRTGYILICIVSPIIAFECGNVVNFIMSSRVVWRDRMKGEPLSRHLKLFVGYNLSYTTVFFVKQGLFMGIQWLTKWDVMYCEAIALFISGLLNFTMNDRVIFRHRSDD